MTMNAPVAVARADSDRRGVGPSVIAGAWKPVDAAGLAAFRVVLGLVIAVSTVRLAAFGWIDELFVQPTFRFSYWGFAWVRPLPAPWMHVAVGAVGVLSLLFSAGLFFRWTAPLLFVGFTYLQLIDVTNYLNHYYLVVLLLGLSAVLPLGRAYALDARWQWGHWRGVGAFPQWMTWLFRFQVAIVYVHAALAKANADWLVYGQPLNLWLSARTQLPVLAWLASWGVHPTTALVFGWCGFLYDLTIWAFLLHRVTRPWAYGVLLCFHGMTQALFPIGMFPTIMTSTALIFFSPSWPRVLARRLRGAGWGAAQMAEASPVVPKRWPLVVAAAFCAFQALFPLRHWLYGGNVLWHEQGMRFSWKVMAREKNGYVSYRVDDGSHTWEVSPRTYLTDRQLRDFSGQPDLILQLGRYIGDDFARRGSEVRVFVDAWVSLNGRRPHRLIDPTVDLRTVEDRVWPPFSSRQSLSSSESLPSKESAGGAASHWILPAPAERPPQLTFAPPERWSLK